MTEPRSRPVNRAAFLQQYHESWNRLATLITQYDAVQMVVPADAAGWNARDHLAHICAWEATMIAFLRKQHQWEACGLTEAEYNVENIDASNEILRLMTLNVSPEDTIGMLKETNTEFLAALAEVSDADLASRATDYHPDWKNKRPDVTVLLVVGGDTWEHFDEHRPWIAAIVKGL